MKKHQFFLIFLPFYLTVLIGFYFNEDNLGKASFDAIHHYNGSKMFTEDFFGTLSIYGSRISEYGTRNSPIFWMFLSILNRFLDYDLIRLLNTFSIFLIAQIFYKCLLLKFKNISTLGLTILTSFIFLSPTLRSLAIWPYSLIWGLYFFILSIYFYLIFENNLNFLNSLKILFFVIIASYIYPSFAVFYLFYLFKIYQKNKSIKLILKLLFISFLLSIPCLYYIFSRDLFTDFQDAQGLNVPLSHSLNISNKILIISSICFYLLMPIINFKESFEKLKSSNILTLITIILFCTINFYFFNFPHSVWGGGFFHKLSNIIFNNNYLFFICSLLSISIIYSILEKNFSNYLLLILLVIYNPQLTIYVKYFDPLVFILFLTLFDFDFKKHFINKSYSYYQFYLIIIFYYFAIYGKKLIL